MGAGGGSTQAVSLTAFSQFFFLPLPLQVLINHTYSLAHEGAVVVGVAVVVVVVTTVVVVVGGRVVVMVVVIVVVMVVVVTVVVGVFSPTLSPPSESGFLSSEQK